MGRYLIGQEENLMWLNNQFCPPKKFLRSTHKSQQITLVKMSASQENIIITTVISIFSVISSWQHRWYQYH
jgi:hypothetical protein